jgi:hypothetical protein
MHHRFGKLVGCPAWELLAQPREIPDGQPWRHREDLRAEPATADGDAAACDVGSSPGRAADRGAEPPHALRPGGTAFHPAADPPAKTSGATPAVLLFG